MYRYFAIAWDSRNAQGAEHARKLAEGLQGPEHARQLAKWLQGPEHARKRVGPLQGPDRRWSVVREGPGLLILHRDAGQGLCRAYALSAFGVILGRLFHRGSSVDDAYQAVTELSAAEAREIGGRGGTAYLVDRYWGRYVALTRDEDGALRVVRDPSGGMPAYFCRLDGVDLIFSHMEDCLRVRQRPMAINSEHLRAYLRFNRVVSAETGYQEVQQVLAGETVHFVGRHIARSFAWHPAPFAEAAARGADDVDRAQAELKTTIRRSVQAWASCHRRILHELSGGLDSSIVLACLASAPSRPWTLCFNLYTQEPEGDERALARSVAQRCGSELKEILFRPSLPRRLEDLLIAHDLASPQQATIRTESEEAKRRLVTERGVEAIYSGQGGDHLFHRRRSALTAAEFVQRYGVGAGCLSVLLNSARMAEQPLTSVIAAVLRFGVFRRRYDPYAGVTPPAFVAASEVSSSAAHREAGSVVHPWIQDTHHLPAAKSQQVADLLETQCFYAAPCTYADVVHPILSQPVIECCLRLPTYLLTHGGVERGLVRAAFSNELPAEIVERTAKGDATAYYHQFILQNLSAIRERLLEGWLVRERLLNRALLERALAESALMDSYVEPYILAAMMAEAWAESAV